MTKTSAGVANDVIYVPKTLRLVESNQPGEPLQLFAYHIARARGCDVDKPRNLAKECHGGVTEA